MSLIIIPLQRSLDHQLIVHLLLPGRFGSPGADGILLFLTAYRSRYDDFPVLSEDLEIPHSGCGRPCGRLRGRWVLLDGAAYVTKQPPIGAAASASPVKALIVLIGPVAPHPTPRKTRCRLL